MLATMQATKVSSPRPSLRRQTARSWAGAGAGIPLRITATLLRRKIVGIHQEVSPSVEFEMKQWARPTAKRCSNPW